MMENTCKKTRKKIGILCKCEQITSRMHRNASLDGVDESDLHRVKSLTENEKYFLKSLLIDSPPRDQSRKLTDAMLFSTPYTAEVKEVKWDSLEDGPLHAMTASDSNTNHFVEVRRQKMQRNSEHHTVLWRAHEIGILPSFLLKASPSSILRKRPKPSGRRSSQRRQFTRSDAYERGVFLNQPDEGKREHTESDYEQKESENSFIPSSNKSLDSIRTDVSQCKTRSDDSSVSSASSWDDVPGSYDSWQVLKDEYAEDFGFDYNVGSGIVDADADENRRCFKILGTSADDLSAQPHVLCPPLMESLLSFVPESLSCENWWLKYSLIRDGACLDTFKNYTKAAQYTVLAIQTTTGSVFGCFTTSCWKTDHGYYGGGESFVWKMRHNRLQPCSSLYEQAQMESECDVYPFSGFNNCSQICTHDMLGVGSGEIDHALVTDETAARVFSEEHAQELGFAIALHDDLLKGTTSASATFCNPPLTGSDEMFDVLNLEVWTFTPCSTVESAERLEMRKYLMQSSTSLSTTSIGSVLTGSSSSPMSSQRTFYRRIGENDEMEFQRDQWIATSIKSEVNTYSPFSAKTPSFIS